MSRICLVLLVLLLQLSSVALAQSRFGENSRLTDVIVMVQPFALDLPSNVGESSNIRSVVRIPEIASLLERHRAVSILRSFPEVTLADTSLVNVFGQSIRLLDRTLIYRFRFPLGSDLNAIVRSLEASPGILFAYEIPNYMFGSDTTSDWNAFTYTEAPLISIPNDSHFPSRQWNLYHTGIGHQPPVTSEGRADIRAVEA
jgi:hypothetical protein